MAPGRTRGLCFQQLAAKPQYQLLRVTLLVMPAKRLYGLFMIRHRPTSALSFTDHADGLVQKPPFIGRGGRPTAGTDPGQHAGFVGWNVRLLDVFPETRRPTADVRWSWHGLAQQISNRRSQRASDCIERLRRWLHPRCARLGAVDKLP